MITLYKPVYAILFNIQTNRYHPILFRGVPFPGNVDGHRYKSIGHHTKGLDTREEAIEDIKRSCQQLEAVQPEFDITPRQ